MFGSQCVRLNIRSALLIVVCFFLNGIKFTSTAHNHMEVPTKSENHKNSTNSNPDYLTISSPSQTELMSCPTEASGETVECKQLPFPCIKCSFNLSCIYGKEQMVTCSVANPHVVCIGPRDFQRSMICRYCWQTEAWEHTCILKDGCNSANQIYLTNCSVQPDLLCLGARTFPKRLRCNWTHGYRWSTALFISITLGGFGADRFYLGHWQEGIGKLFSFGGLGVWTLIDVILISLHYLGPADGSLYI
ncbi:TM2 domain-containing protein almondex [Sitodiplosis mosellana]|uniref:TM2 domain-containing protein almondex n=1 Tax=Sitodiplosis mosellana TaxID=263140 RepID=UPI0024450599|nr:TM2 domain-containing protein almondex [Sitodiplosis mosellana]